MGLECCHHLDILLDQDQNPWPNNLLRYRMKFRFWFQEYLPARVGVSAASHDDMARMYWQTESFAGEYDVPQGALPLAPGMSQDALGNFIYTITSDFTTQDMVWNCDWTKAVDQCTRNATGLELRYAGGHCHAPSCISLQLYIVDTGELVCEQIPHYGQGNPDDRFDELGYEAVPPCLWGSKDEGLLPPILLKWNTTLRTVKKNNANIYHYGEMASWQMRAVFVY